MKKYLLIIILCIFCTGCFTVPEPPEPEPDGIKYRMFAVGVGDYISYSSGVDLPCADLNAEKMANLAYSCRFGEEQIRFSVVEKLVDWDATKENILEGILNVFTGADEDDVSYFYIIAHGGLHQENPDSDFIPCLAPADVKFELYNTLITVHELEECLSSIPGTKVVWVESCHSGNLIDKGNTDFNTKIIDVFSQAKDLLNQNGYQVLVSSSGDEYSYIHGYWSYFAQAIFEGCSGLSADRDGDGIINQYELYKFIQEWVGNIQHVQAYPEDSTFPLVEY